MADDKTATVLDRLFAGTVSEAGITVDRAGRFIARHLGPEPENGA